MRRCRRHGLSLNSKAAGVTLIELLVTLVILSILALAALPYAELTIRRNQELELRAALRQVRTAIDRFHEDWRNGRIPKLSSGVSQHGYPKTLAVLVEGVSGEGVSVNRYLRRIPVDPLNPENIDKEEIWVLRAYLDNADALSWGGEDVYDIRSRSEKTAINGSLYKVW